jgi:hypothetical protein
MPTKVRMVHTVEYNPNAEAVPTGVVDGDGRIRIVPKSVSHKPGTILEIDDVDVVRRLLEAGAIEILDGGYSDMIENAENVIRAERGASFAKAPEPEKWPQPTYAHERFNTDTDLF